MISGERPPPAGRLLVIDDEADVRELVMDVAQSLGFETAEAESLDLFRLLRSVLVAFALVTSVAG